MSAIENYIKKIADEEAEKALEETADELLDLLIKETQSEMDNYYAFPEGSYYTRTGSFEGAYQEVYAPSGKGESKEITVGVDFSKMPYYPFHGSGVDSQMIYDWNLEGWHGDNGNSGDILEHMNDYADELAGF